MDIALERKTKNRCDRNTRSIGMNITLIGMPASGKSMVGVLLAKRLGMEFIDGDLLIQKQEKRLLKEIIEQEGIEQFIQIESEVHEKLQVTNTVIAPGGSVIYSEKAMKHLKEIGIVVYLKVSYEEIANRLGNVKERGVVLKDGMTLRDLYDERVPLYEKYADITVNEDGMSAGQIVDYLRKNDFGYKME